MSETAFASCSKSRIRAAAERGDGRAKTALLILDDFDKAISTLLICTNIVHIATAAIVTVAVKMCIRDSCNVREELRTALPG